MMLAAHKSGAIRKVDLSKPRTPGGRSLDASGSAQEFIPELDAPDYDSEVFQFLIEVDAGGSKQFYNLPELNMDGAFWSLRELNKDVIRDAESITITRVKPQ